MKRLIAPAVSMLLCACLVLSACAAGKADLHASDALHSWITALQPEGMKQMTVAEFRDHLLPLMDTEQARTWQQLLQDDSLYEQRSADSLLAYYYNVVEPLTAEHWQMRDFGGAVDLGNAHAEYVLTLHVSAPERVTTGRYAEAPASVRTEFQHILAGVDDNLLQDCSAVHAVLLDNLNALFQSWAAEGLDSSVELTYRFDRQEEASPGAGTAEAAASLASADDYTALFELMTSNWQYQTLADFNRRLMAWADSHPDSHRRLDADAARDLQPNDLDPAERSFLQSVFLSGMESGRYVESIYLGTDERLPVVNVRLPEKRTLRADRSASWADLQLSFSYVVQDPESITVAERDHAVEHVIRTAGNLWAELPLDQVRETGEAALREQFRSLGADCSTSGLQFSIVTDMFMLDMNDGAPLPD